MVRFASVRRGNRMGSAATILTGLGIALIVLVPAVIYFASRRNLARRHDEALGHPGTRESINACSSRPSGPLRIFCGRPSGTPRRCARKPPSKARRRPTRLPLKRSASPATPAGNPRSGAGARGQDASARRPDHRHRPARTGPTRARQGAGRTGTERRGESRVPSSWSPNASANCSESPASRPKKARDLLLKQLEADARRDSANLVKRLEAEARQTAAVKAQQIIADAIQRSAAEHTIETTVSVVDLPSDDLKGRIIGREGRNIRALETATGVELIVDDTPGAIILSSFDPFRRETARQAIERLIADGRIHPARIEEVVEKVKAEMEETVRQEGEAAAFELGLFDLHPEVLRLMGRLKFRTSYGQNVLNHSKEVAFLAGIMSKELGLNAQVATRAAFLHDIGKAIDRDLQGTHLELGLDFLRKHGESEPVLRWPSAAHHMDIDWPSVEAMIVQAADAISAARPGARREILESTSSGSKSSEGIADSFQGVSKAFALQAGREIRIVVESDRISDEETVWLSKDIARRIENELEYPGQIKVTVIRETRAATPPASEPLATDDGLQIGSLGERGLVSLIRQRFPRHPLCSR